MKKTWNRWRYKLRKYRPHSWEMKQLRRELKPLSYSAHERLKNEALARQRKTWEQKLADQAAATKALSSRLDSVLHSELALEGEQWRLILTVDKNLLDHTFLWGNDDTLLRMAADHVGSRLYHELRQRNHLRMREGERYELGCFDAYRNSYAGAL